MTGSQLDRVTLAAAELTVRGALPATQTPDGLLERLTGAGLRPVRGEWLRVCPQEGTDPVGEPDVEVAGLNRTALQVLALCLALSGWPHDGGGVSRRRLASLPFAQTTTRVLLGSALNELRTRGFLTVDENTIRPGPALAGMPPGRTGQLAQVITQLRSRLAADGLAGCETQ